MSDLRVVEAGADDAERVRDVIHAAFGPRPRLNPPSTALSETTASVADALGTHGGVLCWVDDEPAGAVLFDDAGTALAMRRVSVVPHFQSRGVASAIVGVAEEIAAARGYDDIKLKARTELPATVVFWERRGYSELTHNGTDVTFGKALPLELGADTADDTRAIGARLARVCRAGDVVLLTGELGAGKTTLTQGLGESLLIRGDVTSPTFVISRVHPSLVDGPALVHVDAYRLGDEAELDDLDLDAYVEDAVTVVEWGGGIAEALSDDRLRVHLARSQGESGDERRTVTVVPVGARWFGAGVRSTLLATGSALPASAP